VAQHQHVLLLYVYSRVNSQVHNTQHESPSNEECTQRTINIFFCHDFGSKKAGASLGKRTGKKIKFKLTNQSGAIMRTVLRCSRGPPLLEAGNGSTLNSPTGPAPCFGCKWDSNLHGHSPTDSKQSVRKLNNLMGGGSLARIEL